MRVCSSIQRSWLRAGLTANRCTRTPPSTVVPAGCSSAQVKWSRAQVVSTSTSWPWATMFSAVRRQSISAPPTTPAP